MSHWAEIDKDNKVIRVLVGDNNDPVGDEGYQWLMDNLNGTWIKTSYNNNIRGNYAGIGMFYCDEHDLFMWAKCHDQAVLNAETARWDCTNKDHENDPIA
jgi:hypothetical protein